MSKENLKNYKFYLGAALGVTLLLGAIYFDFKPGFFNDLLAAVGYLTSGVAAGAVAYYIFLDDRIY